MTMASYRIDPRCAGFRWPDLPTAGARLLSAEQVGDYNRDGVVVLRGVVDQATLDVVTVELDALEAELKSTPITLDGELAYDYPRDAITFVKQPIARSPAVRAFLTGPLMQGVAHDLVGSGARLYWDQAVYKKPGKGPEFPWHQDNGYTFTEPLTYITCWVPLGDASIEDGCPWVAPGAHRHGVLAHARGPCGLEIEGVDALLKEHPPASTPVKAGDMVVFSSLMPHRTGPNGGGRIRRALIAQYIADGAVVLGSDGTRIPANDPDLNPVVS
jgi:ectoine hydroxylase-related dioxygenase (phytanoyl-CoA dioxygenase family)